jgi:hypothetical protein
MSTTKYLVVSRKTMLRSKIALAVAAALGLLLFPWGDGRSFTTTETYTCKLWEYVIRDASTKHLKHMHLQRDFGASKLDLSTVAIEKFAQVVACDVYDGHPLSIDYYYLKGSRLEEALRGAERTRMNAAEPLRVDRTPLSLDQAVWRNFEREPCGSLCESFKQVFVDRPTPDWFRGLVRGVEPRLLSDRNAVDLNLMQRQFLGRAVLLGNPEFFPSGWVFATGDVDRVVYVAPNTQVHWHLKDK